MEALQATELLKADGVNARVINICTVKPLDEDIILRAAADCRRVVTCEEHSINRRAGRNRCSSSWRENANAL